MLHIYLKQKFKEQQIWLKNLKDMVKFPKFNEINYSTGEMRWRKRTSRL